MKFSPLVILITLLLASCVKKVETEQLGDPTSTFKCQIDGEAYEVSGFYAYAVDDGTEFIVYGNEDLINNDDARLLYFVIHESTGEGSYELGDEKDGIGYYTNKNGTFTFLTIPEGSDGTAKVRRKTSDRIVGSFNFTAINPDTDEVVKITNGSFDVEIRG